MIQKRRSWSAALAGTAALMTSVAALADTTATVAMPDAPSASVSSIETPAYKKIMDRMGLLLFSQWYGSSVGKITDPLQPDEYGRTKVGDEGKPNGAQEFDNTLLTSYKLDDNGLAAGFAINEVSYMYGKGNILVDPYVKVSKTNLIKSGNFSYNADLRSYLPVSNLSHEAHRITRFRSFSTANYDIPNSKFSLISYNDINYYIFGSQGAANAKDVGVAIQPTVNYQLMAPLGFFVGYEMDAKHTKDKGLNDWYADGTYFYLGTSWDITSKMNFTPFLALRPGGSVNADSTELQAYFTYKFL
jgi:hypothetical protein